MAVMIGGCAADRPATLVMPHVSGAPAGDVPLDESLWAEASFTAPLARPLALDGAKPKGPGDCVVRAKFAWDADHLYVLIESVGPRPSSPFTQQDDLLHEADVAEIFLDPTGRRLNIFEIQVSPENVTNDYHHIWDKPATYPADRIDFPFSKAHQTVDHDWDAAGLRTRSVLVDRPDGRTMWTVMMAIPLRHLFALAGREGARLKPGDALYVNLMRYARPPLPDGKRALEQYNLVPVRTGCPHHSPMAVVKLIAVK